jgi:hypothetical protein
MWVTDADSARRNSPNCGVDVNFSCRATESIPKESSPSTVLYGVMSSRAGAPRSWSRSALGAWFALMVLLGAGLLAKHVVALPVPTASEHLARSLGALRGEHAEGFLAVHVLYAECRCSQRIVRHLTTTARPRGWHEVVLWVGEAEPEPELARRFDVRRLTAPALAELGVESAPLLVALDSSDRALYLGGYTERKQGPAIHDLEILASAERAVAPPSLPVFGCAVSERLKRALAALPAP